MKSMQTLRLLAGLGVIVLLNACTSPPQRLYDGAPRAAAEIAELRVPEQIEIARINGKTLKDLRSTWSRDDKRLQLAPGRYEILAYYREIWELGNQHDVLRSNPALFVVDAVAGGHYRLGYAQPAGYAAAQTLALQFSGWVEDADGARTPSQPSRLKFRDGLLAQFSGRDELMADDEATTVSGTQVVAPQAPLAAPLPAAAASTPPQAVSDREWLSLMQGFWQQASSEERRAFLRWLATQPGS